VAIGLLACGVGTVTSAATDAPGIVRTVSGAGPTAGRGTTASAPAVPRPDVAKGRCLRVVGHMKCRDRPLRPIRR
jgi:hypothetical protein